VGRFEEDGTMEANITEVVVRECLEGVAGYVRGKRDEYLKVRRSEERRQRA